MSVYQAQGKPLSAQAIYQQKLKQGVYDSPSKPSLGVASSASDTAALLAASSDLTVKPSYERLRAAPEAHNAAMAAKVGQAKNGATAQPSPAPYLGVPSSYNQGPMYKQAQSNSTSTMTSRTTPMKSVSKHGLNTASTPTSALDIGKISQVADKNSSSLLNKRFNPEQDHRSGLMTKPTEFLTQQDENFAAQSAGRSLTMHHGAGYTDSISSQRRTKTFQASDVVDAALVAAASSKAQERLKPLHSTAQADLREQAQLYSKALTAAQKNCDDRLKAHQAGMVDLGGGLMLPISEVDKLANLIVQPVLADLDSKAVAQRQFEEAQQAKHIELKTLHAQFKKDEEDRKRSEKVQRIKEKDQRIFANEERKKAENTKYEEYQGEQHTRVETTTQELRALQEKYADEKAALLQEKKENEERISEEETALINGRKEELDSMQKEKDEILKPTLDELKVETEKLNSLISTKDQLTSEVESGDRIKAEYEEKLKLLKEKLEQTNSEIESTTLEHDQFVTRREATDVELQNLQESTEKTLKGIEDYHAALDAEITSLAKQKETNIATKASHKKDINEQIEKQVRGEYEVNKELPEHLREEIDEDKLRDTGSLFSFDETKITSISVDKDDIRSIEQPRSDTQTNSPVHNQTMKPQTEVNHEHQDSSKKKGFRARLKNAFTTPQHATKESKMITPPVNASPTPVAKTHPHETVTDHEDMFDHFDEDLAMRNNGKKAGFFKEEI